MSDDRASRQRWDEGDIEFVSRGPSPAEKVDVELDPEPTPPEERDGDVAR